jgi:hypothetical protein
VSFSALRQMTARFSTTGLGSCALTGPDGVVIRGHLRQPERLDPDGGGGLVQVGRDEFRCLTADIPSTLGRETPVVVRRDDLGHTAAVLYTVHLIELMKDGVHSRITLAPRIA